MNVVLKRVNLGIWKDKKMVVQMVFLNDLFLCFWVRFLGFLEGKGGHTTTPLIVPSAKFVKQVELSQWYQGFEGCFFHRRFTAVFTAVFVFLCIMLHLLRTKCYYLDRILKGVFI